MKDLNYIGTTTHTRVNGGKAIPLYSMDNFLNTLAGWSLQCYDRTHYSQANEIWNSLTTAEDRKAFECQVLEYLEIIKNRPMNGNSQSDTEVKPLYINTNIIN